MKNIVILGTGGNCIDILDALWDINEATGSPVYTCVGFLDDNQEKWDQVIHGVRVLGPLAMANQLDDSDFVFGIGSAANHWNRDQILLKAAIEDERFATVVHPTASVSRLAHLGCGCVIFQNATVTSGATLGRHVLVLPNSVISHDDVIGDFACIAGGACVSGDVRIGEGCYIGTNAAIKDGVTVGARSLVGMGAVVIGDVPDGSVVVGSPARFLRSTRPE